MKKILFLIPFLVSCVSLNSITSICKEDELNIESFVVDKSIGTKQLSIIKDISEELSQLNEYGDLNIEYVTGTLFSTQKMQGNSNFLIFIKSYGENNDLLLLEQKINNGNVKIDLNLKLDPNLVYRMVSSGPVVYTFVFSGDVPNFSKFKSEICFGANLHTNKTIF